MVWLNEKVAMIVELNEEMYQKVLYKRMKEKK